LLGHVCSRSCLVSTGCRPVHQRRFNVSATWDGEGREGRLHFRSNDFVLRLFYVNCHFGCGVQQIIRYATFLGGNGENATFNNWPVAEFILGRPRLLCSASAAPVGAVLIHLFEPPVHSVFRQGIWVQPYGMSKLRSQAETHNQWPKPGIEALTCRKVAA